MIWIDYVLLALLAVVIFGTGFFSGYVMDKKEARDFYEEALRISGEADRNLEAAKKCLDDAKNKLNEAKEIWKEAEERLKVFERMTDEGSGSM